MNIIEKKVKHGRPILEKDHITYCRSSSELLNQQKEAVSHWYDEQYDSLEQMMVDCKIPEETRKLIMSKCPRLKLWVGIYKNLIRNLIPEKELENYSFRDIELVQSKLSDPIYKEERRLFGRLLKELESKNRLVDVRIINKRRKQTEDIMDLEDYVNLAILVFNPKYTPELIKKTMASKQMANRWLIISTLFLCAHRVSDIRNIPCIGIIGEPDKLEHLLGMGELPKEEAEKYVMLLEMKYDYIGYKPQKTKYRGSDNLRFVVPNEYRQIYGTILAINALHHFYNPEVDFVTKRMSISYRNLVELLGEGVKK